MTKEMPFVTKYCRMCAVELKAGVFIFGEEGKRLHLPEKIRKTLAILVLEEDSLPKKICTDCCSSLEDYAQYKDTVLDAQEKLASIAKNLENASQSESDNNNKASSSRSSRESSRSPRKAEQEVQTGPVEERIDEGSLAPSTSKSFRRENGEMCLAVKCGFCPSSSSEVFEDRQKVVAHISKSHGDVRNQLTRYRCPHCPKVTERYNMLRLHIERHASSERRFSDMTSSASSLSAGNTAKGLDNQRIFRNELSRKFEVSSHSCKECGKRFQSRKAMEDHVTSRHDVARETLVDAELCQDLSDTSLPADCTEDDYDDDYNLADDSCAVNMRSDNIDRPVGDETQRHKSPSKVSPFTTTRDGRKEQSLRENGENSKFQDIGGGGENGKTIDADGKLWKCNVCSKILTSNTGYHNHMMVHKGRRFNCDQCGVSYLQKATLLHHVKVHHVDVPKKYKCSACDKEFHELKFLTQHAKIHSTPSQEFQCNICQKIYKTGRCLRRHVKLHSSNKKYVCNLCGKAFRVKSKLDEHENSHTGKRPLGCNFCDKAFNGHPNYVKHIRRKHPNEISRENKIPPPKKMNDSARSSDPAPSHAGTVIAQPSHQPPPPPAPAVPQAGAAQVPIPTPAPAHSCDLQLQNPQSLTQPSAYASSSSSAVSGKNFVNPSGVGNNGPSGSSSNNANNCGGPNSTVNALDLMDCAIQSALAGESAAGNSNSYENHQAIQSQNEPMELSYKLESSAFQDMPMELTKVFQRDPLELCVRQDLNQLMDLSSRVDTGGIVTMSMNMAGVNVHKLDLTERELMDLSGAFRQPIDLIARTEDTPHDLYNEGSLVDLSLRSTFGQDQSASSFLRELIDLSARSDSFHGELDLTKPHHSHGNAHQTASHTNSGVPHGGGTTSNNISPKSGASGSSHNNNNNNVGTSLQNVVYQDAMFSLQN